MKKYLNGQLTECTTSEIAEIQDFRSEKDLARPLKNWISEMAATDIKVPRAVEDIYDVLTPEQKAALPETLKTSIAEKKRLRSEKP